MTNDKSCLDQYVTFRDLIDFHTTTNKEIVKMASDMDEAMLNSSKGIFNQIIGEIRDIKYEKIRDTSFVLSMLGNIGGTWNQEFVKTYYEKYCEEFDKLNKEFYYDERIKS